MMAKQTEKNMRAYSQGRIELPPSIWQRTGPAHHLARTFLAGQESDSSCLLEIFLKVVDCLEEKVALPSVEPITESRFCRTGGRKRRAENTRSPRERER